MTSYSLTPVGRVSVSGDRAGIDIFPDYRDALAHLEDFSHILVCWWAHHCDTPESRNRMRTGLPYAPGVTAGVFACRSEFRPNPIGITTARVLAVDTAGGRIETAWMDAHDGTPVLDIKPYFPVSDRVRSPRTAPWAENWPKWVEDAAGMAEIFPD